MPPSTSSDDASLGGEEASGTAASMETDASTPDPCSGPAVLAALEQKLPSSFKDCFRCPLTLSVMSTPTITKYGTSYDRDALLKHLETSKTDPINRQRLTRREIYPNLGLSRAIEHWRAANPTDDVDSSDDDWQPAPGPVAPPQAWGIGVDEQPEPPPRSTSAGPSRRDPSTTTGRARKASASSVIAAAPTAVSRLPHDDESYDESYGSDSAASAPRRAWQHSGNRAPHPRSIRDDRMQDDDEEDEDPEWMPNRENRPSRANFGVARTVGHGAVLGRPQVKDQFRPAAAAADVSTDVGVPGAPVVITADSKFLDNGTGLLMVLENNQFQCVFCTKVFSNRDLADRHRETAHPRLFANKALLRLHNVSRFALTQAANNRANQPPQTLTIAPQPQPQHSRLPVQRMPGMPGMGALAAAKRDRASSRPSHGRPKSVPIHPGRPRQNGLSTMGTGSASPADLGTGRPRQFPTGGANPAKKAKMSISGAGAQGGAVGTTPAQKPSNAVDAAKDAAVWASYGKNSQEPSGTARHTAARHTAADNSRASNDSSRPARAAVGLNNDIGYQPPQPLQGRSKNLIPVKGRKATDGKWTVWDSCVAASEACSVDMAQIRKVCQKKQDNANGWVFRWAPEENMEPLPSQPQPQAQAYRRPTPAPYTTTRIYSRQPGAQQTTRWPVTNFVGRQVEKFFPRYGKFPGSVIKQIHDTNGAEPPRYQIRFIDGEEQSVDLIELTRILVDKTGTKS